MGNPVFAFSEVEFVSSGIAAVDSFAERTNGVQVGVQVAGSNSLFSLLPRGFAPCSTTPRFSCLVNHLVVAVGGGSGLQAARLSFSH